MAATLCLACSSSPFPKSQSSSTFITLCCSRTICERCLEKNPRLRRYNPCLACLSAVAVLDKSGTRDGKLEGDPAHVTIYNPSEQPMAYEEAMFVLGDSDEESDGSNNDVAKGHEALQAYLEEPRTDMASTIINHEALIEDATNAVRLEAGGSNSPQYYVQPGDTLRGIALKYGVDGRKVCQLNSLPTSTLSTTPHLLHTRTRLILPPTQCPILPPPTPEALEARTRERAEMRFQFVTKEVDQGITKAYMALAENEDDGEKAKGNWDAVKSPIKRMPQDKAVDHYLDDDDWEATQNGGCHVNSFPWFAGVKENK